MSGTSSPHLFIPCPAEHLISKVVDSAPASPLCKLFFASRFGTTLVCFDNHLKNCAVLSGPHRWLRRFAPGQAGGWGTVPLPGHVLSDPRPCHVRRPVAAKNSTARQPRATSETCSTARALPVRKSFAGRGRGMSAGDRHHVCPAEGHEVRDSAPDRRQGG